MVVVGRSNIVGLPLALMALHRDATLTVCHIRTPQGDDGCHDGDDVGGDDDSNDTNDSTTRFFALCVLVNVVGFFSLNVDSKWTHPAFAQTHKFVNQLQQNSPRPLVEANHT